jgi:hypothetical protein
MANEKFLCSAKTVFVGLAVLVVLAFVSCGSSSSDETETYVPKIGKAKLLAPKGSGARMVPAGMTKGDLDRAFNAYFEPHLSVLRGEGEAEINKEMDDYVREINHMAESGRFTLVVNGTECRVIEADSNYSKVKILDGPSHQFGKTFWVYSPTVVNQ